MKNHGNSSEKPRICNHYKLFIGVWADHALKATANIWKDRHQPNLSSTSDVSFLHNTKHPWRSQTGHTN